ncbi:hypothetical protein NW761_011938 [Fusarium oxysporum]|nr:hypothetical protein NW758_013096 [Fusarium oxysporum]KAJ4078425.1 hypothetical protein NW761_011938 [Fusarium oxysporum]WKT43875.1 hypothetical protein QSH57_008728 [Fusarium oxysporum f. sp. vasinfectum]
MDYSHDTAYEPFARTTYAVEEPEDGHPEMSNDEQQLIKKQNKRRRKAQAPSSYASAFARGISLAIAISVAAVQSGDLSVWSKTRNGTMVNPQGKFKPKAWPAVLDLKPTYIMLCVALVTAVVQMLAILTHVAPFREIRQARWHSIATYCSSSVLILVWIGGLIYFKLANTMAEKKSMWDIWSWSCKRKSADNPDIPWARMCTTNIYTFYISIAAVLFEIFSLIYFTIKQRQAKARNGKISQPYAKVTKVSITR